MNNFLHSKQSVYRCWHWRHNRGRMFNQQDQLRNALYFTLYSVVRKGKDDICSCFISVLYVMLLQYIWGHFFWRYFCNFCHFSQNRFGLFSKPGKIGCHFYHFNFGGVKMGKVAKISTYQHFFETWCQKEVGEVAKVLVNIAFEKSDPYVYTL